MSSTDWKKAAIASRPLYSVGSPNVARYGSSKAPSSANISAAFFGSLSDKAVYSSMSSLALFMDISPVPDHQLVRTLQRVEGSRNSPASRRNQFSPQAEPIRAWFAG